MRLFKDRKGNWVDLAKFMPEALGIGLLIVIVFIFLSMFNTNLNTVASSDPILNDTVALGYSQSVVSKFPARTDFILPLLYVFVLGFSVWSARLIQSSHKLFFVLFFISMLLFIMATFIESAWYDFTSQASVSSYISSFPITDFMLDNLRLFISFASFIVGVSLYAKKE